MALPWEPHAKVNQIDNDGCPTYACWMQKRWLESKITHLEQKLEAARKKVAG